MGKGLTVLLSVLQYRGKDSMQSSFLGMAFWLSSEVRRSAGAVEVQVACTWGIQMAAVPHTLVSGSATTFDYTLPRLNDGAQDPDGNDSAKKSFPCFGRIDLWADDMASNGLVPNEL